MRTIYLKTNYGIKKPKKKFVEFNDKKGYLDFFGKMIKRKLLKIVLIKFKLMKKRGENWILNLIVLTNF